MSTILIKHFYSKVSKTTVNYSTTKCGWNLFFVIKPKWKLFWRIIDTLLQILRKDFTKIRSQTNLVWFRIVGAWWLELLDILRVLWKWTQFGSNLYDKYSLVLYEKCWQHLGVLWTLRSQKKDLFKRKIYFEVEQENKWTF